MAKQPKAVKIVKPSVRGMSNMGYLGHFAQDRFIQAGHNTNTEYGPNDPRKVPGKSNVRFGDGTGNIGREWDADAMKVDLPDGDWVDDGKGGKEYKFKKGNDDPPAN